MKIQKRRRHVLWLLVVSLSVLSGQGKRYEVENYYWMNTNDKITMDIDGLLGKEDNINNLTVEVEKGKMADSGMYVQMPRDLFKIELKPEKKLEELEIKEILYHNDEAGFLAYSFL